MSESKLLQSVAYEHLREMIAAGGFEFGKVYSETKIASEISISRTPMRDALTRLKQERYIDILPNKGFMLHKPTARDITEGYHVRAAIERYCARQLACECEKGGARDMLTEMRSALDCQRALSGVKSPLNLMAFWQSDVKFHGAMLKYVNVPAFNTEFNACMHFFMSPSIKGFTIKGRDISTINEHDRILAAIEAGEAEKAEAEVLNHLNTTLPLALMSLE